ncbi:MAG: peptidase S8 [Calditrichaeota bacterium]|nr:peptidase S8 [Calditrichota bacterium]
MRSLTLFLLSGLLASGASALAPDSGLPQLPEWAIADSGLPPCVKDRLVVRVRDSFLPALRSGQAQLQDLPELARFASERAVRSSRALLWNQSVDGPAREGGLDRDLIVELAAGSDLATEIAAWSARPEVEWAERDWMVSACLTPNDTYFTQQWALRNTGQSPGNGTVDCDIDADQAWDLSTGSSTVTIAIVDTGIDLNHPDLQSKIVAGYDFVNNDATADDDNMHGTACGSLAAALSNNGTGVTGVDWLARLMPVKVLNASGNGSTTDVVAGVNWARSNGADVISMSLGGGAYSSTFNSAINTAFNAGVFVVAAAGNENVSTVSYPAKYANCFAVGALSPCNERKSPSSCDGETWWGSNYGTGLDVMAPGVKLRSATINGYINNMNGTSGATPQVAGIAGLLRGADPNVTPAEIRDLLRASAVDMGTAGWDSQTGYGRVNAYEALLLMSPPEPCEIDALPPSLSHVPLSDTWETVQDYPVLATVTDECSLFSVTLRHQLDQGNWFEIPMQPLGGDVYSASIPAAPGGSQITYQVVALDNSSNFNDTVVEHSFMVLDACASDLTAPGLLVTLPFLDTEDSVGPYQMLLEITDPCGISEVVAGYSVNGGANVPVLATPMGGDSWQMLIPGQGAGSQISWYLYARDASPSLNLAADNGLFNVIPPAVLAAPVIQIDRAVPGFLHLSWAAVEGAGSYAVYSAGLDGVFTLHTTTTATSLDWPEVGDELRIFQVRATD